MVSDELQIILLAGIGAATHRKMGLADLCVALEGNGVSAVRSLLATGNLLCHSRLEPTALAARAEEAMASFGVERRAHVLAPAELEQIARANPFPEAVAARPNHLLIHVTGGVDGGELATPPWSGPERLAVAGRVVFVDYVEGVGRSKLTAAKLERLLGVPGTARNWNTWQKLIAAAEEH